MLNSIISSTGITVSSFFICTAVSLVLGLGAAFLAMYKAKYSRSFVLTLAALPAMVQIVIMMVNGNIGAGVAVAGAFGLIRFRSAPGSAKEIGLVFLATAIGLATGMGYVVIAAVFFAVIAVFLLMLTVVGFGAGAADERELKITIPENLDYGTLYELSYKVVLQDASRTKAFLDELRTRNGNLNIVCGKPVTKEAL